MGLGDLTSLFTVVSLLNPYGVLVRSNLDIVYLREMFNYSTKLIQKQSLACFAFCRGGYLSARVDRFMPMFRSM